MADTREFYLVCNDGTIFGSDPKTIYKYLDMSDEGDLNDKAATVIYNFKNQFRVIDDYEIQITLTFNNRAERELFAMTNIDNIWAFGATGKIDKSVIYTKRAMVAGFEFLDNDYTNAIQSILTLKVSGQWQSDLVKYTVPSPDDNGDGTKKYYAGELYETAKDSTVVDNLLTSTSNSLKTAPDSSSKYSGGLIYTFSTTDIATTSGKEVTLTVYINNTSSSAVEVVLYGVTSRYYVGSEVAANSAGYSTVTIPSLSSSDTSRDISIRAFNANTAVSGIKYKLLKLQKDSTVGTNLLTDSSFESGSRDNNQYGYANLATVSVSSDYAYKGTYSLKNYLSNTSTSDTGLVVVNKTLTSSTKYTFSTWVYSETAIGLSLVAYANQNWSSQSRTSVSIPATTWTRVSTTVTPDTSGNGGKIGIFKQNASDTPTFYIDCLKLEKGSAATPWLPNTSDANYSYLCEANYQYYKADENINQYKYGSTNYSNTIQLDIEDNQFIIYFVLNEGENKVTISNDSSSVTLTHTAFNNGELVPLGSEGIDYSLDSRDTVDAFSLWKDGTLLSDDWTVDNVEDYFTLLSILDTIKESPVSIIAQGPEGATLPYTIYTYSKHDFI